MLRRLALRDVAIVDTLEVELGPGFTVLTGETGAGKSILIDALQLALGQRADAAVVREGASRSEICAELDTPASLLPWLQAGGFDDGPTLLLRRTIDAQGRSRAWINGSAATVGQLREASDHLVDIHGQHAWQSLTRASAVRELLDSYGHIDTQAMTQAWRVWKSACDACHHAQEEQARLTQEYERLVWQIAEVGKLNPGPTEWAQLNAQHSQLAHAQSLLDGAQQALNHLSEDERSAQSQALAALHALEKVVHLDSRLGEACDLLRSAQAQVAEATRSLNSYCRHHDPDPQRLSELDERLALWMQLARRFRCQPEGLWQLCQDWQTRLAQVQALGDMQALQQRQQEALQAYGALAQHVSGQRRVAAQALSTAVSSAMQGLGMEGGQFLVNLTPVEDPQSGGMETVEFLVSGHAGATPRPVSRVASGGELSRLALAIAATTAQHHGAGPATLIFDEIDAGVGGTVADQVGRLMKALGQHTQVLAVTHLAQVAACADGHLVVSKHTRNDLTTSRVEEVSAQARVAEIARMLGGERLSGQAHAQTLLVQANRSPQPLTLPRRARSSVSTRRVQSTRPSSA